jgi:membrane-associated protein
MTGFLAMSGATAIALICLVLFLEECGVPLPILPGDVLLATGGILASGGQLHLSVFIAATTVAMCAGALVGHGWSGALGRPALRRFAERLGKADRLDRALARLQRSGWLGVLVLRLVPGMRVYTNLAAGIAGTPRRTFVAGLVPSVFVWTIGFSLLGLLLGPTAESALHAIQGAVPLVLVISGVSVAVLALLLRLPGRGDQPRERGGALRVALAGLVDLAIAAAAVAAVFESAELLPRVIDEAGRATHSAVAGVIILAYVVVSRRAAGATAGEGLLRVSYRRRRRLPS